MKQLQDVKYFFICVAFISGNIYENEDESLRVEIMFLTDLCWWQNGFANRVVQY